VEESTLRIGIPGTGKTAELGCRILDSPGAVVVTSTATDLHDLTHRLRSDVGQVHVFNPGRIGGVPSTLRWSPLVGCDDPNTATRRAVDLMGPPKTGEGERWDQHGRRLLAILLHAAALAGARMSTVRGWVADPDRSLPLILGCLERSPQRAAMQQEVAATLGTNPRTRDGILIAVAPALGWLTSPEAAAAGDPPPDVDLFDLAQFVDRHGTLYLLGDDDGQLAPLVGALTADIAHQARHIASRRPGGRLDPALRMVLDEVALVCPVPLDRWMSELRKRSITIDAACQGMGQLRQRWGRDGASMILNAATAVLLYGGAKDADDLAQFGRLAGDRDEETATRDKTGRITARSVRQVPVITAAELAALPNHRALLVRRGMPVALAATPIVWRRRDVKRASRASSTRATVPAPNSATAGRAATTATRSASAATAPGAPVRHPNAATARAARHATAAR
jgi:type IV secretory pathway TraG/TraD family ATPase VirD4